MARGRGRGWAWALVPIWLLAILALLMAALRGTINNRGYFLKIYEGMGMEARIGISPADCADAMMAMVGYMEGERDTIQLTVRENGRAVAMFNQQEIDHMVDVRNLYQAFCRAEYGGLGALALLLILLAVSRRGGGPARAARRGWWLALLAFGCLLAALGVYAAVDFNDFWTRFHYIFFTNDLWLMDYATCRMIRICPLELFSGIIARFTLLALGGIGLTGLGVALLGRREGKEAGGL